ncbi:MULTISPECIES: hypothetical protein [unclassified Mesorhizobium]|uniref:hypothetical protein n=1 Tax=unclassified Mesorhizobium TaxID=325217 RepID=UPI00163DC2A4|nr:MULTISPECIES: hypothetical protein [unclassified Mesorhizobium]
MSWIMKPRREIDTPAVCRRYGICDTTLDRWLDNRANGFPSRIGAAGAGSG